MIFNVVDSRVRDMRHRSEFVEVRLRIPKDVLIEAIQEGIERSKKEQEF